jgi:hypothetical protein
MRAYFIIVLSILVAASWFKGCELLLSPHYGRFARP